MKGCCVLCRTEEADGLGVELEKNVAVVSSVTEGSAVNVAKDVHSESHDRHMDQSDGPSSSDDESAHVQPPEVLVCAAADSTTPDDGSGLWVEDRQPTAVEGIEEEDEDGGGREEDGGGHKGGKVRQDRDVTWVFLIFHWV